MTVCDCHHFSLPPHSFLLLWKRFCAHQFVWRSLVTSARGQHYLRAFIPISVPLTFGSVSTLFLAKAKGNECLPVCKSTKEQITPEYCWCFWSSPGRKFLWIMASGFPEDQVPLRDFYDDKRNPFGNLLGIRPSDVGMVPLSASFCLSVARSTGENRLAFKNLLGSTINSSSHHTNL